MKSTWGSKEEEGVGLIGVRGGVFHDNITGYNICEDNVDIYMQLCMRDWENNDAYKRTHSSADSGIHMSVYICVHVRLLVFVYLRVRLYSGCWKNRSI